MSRYSRLKEKGLRFYFQAAVTAFHSAIAVNR